MPTTKLPTEKPPSSYAALVAEMPPQALLDETHYDNAVERIDRLMAAGKLTKDQQLYLETLVQLVEVYESKHHAIDLSDLTGIDALRHLLDSHNMTASDLARLLGIHPTMGSKLLNNDRALTVDHIKKLAAHFKVRPDLFL
jgi:HTH-type transcriptional regulator/antitoxin HigA